MRTTRQRRKRRSGFAWKKFEKHKLEMKLVDVEYTFDNNKILFYFTADGRVDFRELVKDLASVFKTRIELRQIGVRDEAKMLGGLGICGRPFCCCSFFGRVPAGVHQNGKGAGTVTQPDQNFGNLRQADVLFKIRAERL